MKNSVLLHKCNLLEVYNYLKTLKIFKVYFLFVRVTLLSYGLIFFVLFELCRYSLFSFVH